jgi:hypothetical protein
LGAVASGGCANRIVPIMISAAMISNGTLNSRCSRPPELYAPAMASMVSVWMMPSMVANPGLRTGTRRKTSHAIRCDVALLGKRETSPYFRLGLALRVSVSTGGTVSSSGSLCVGNRYAPPPPQVTSSRSSPV